jgi:hypothetical protein
VSSFVPFRRALVDPRPVRFSRGRRAACAVLVLCACHPSAFSQRGGNPIAGTAPGAVPLVNVGGVPMDAQFFTLDFAQRILAQQNKKPNQQERARQQGLVDSGSLSALDLAAPAKAVNEFNRQLHCCGGHVPPESCSTPFGFAVSAWEIVSVRAMLLSESSE